MPILHHAETVLRAAHLPHGSTLVVAVSGGADSLALMHLLWANQARLGVQVHVATFDHGWRGEQSAADAVYVAERATAWGLPVTVGNYAGEKVTSGLEAAARFARYTFLARVARQVGAGFVATAHHADDQAETVLMRILRGTGIHGLAGMRPTAPLPTAPDLTIIRPLLAVHRAAIDAYCATQGIIPRHDPTNDDTDYLRNKLRHETLPTLRQINPNVANALTTLAESASGDDDYLQAQVAAVLRVFAKLSPERCTFPRADFAALHIAIQRRVMRALVAHLTPQAELSFERVEAARLAALHGQVGTRIEFEGGLWLHVDYKEVWVQVPFFAPISPLSLNSTEEIEVVLDVPIPLQHGSLLFSHTPLDGGIMLSTPVEARITLRTRRAGDRVQRVGMSGHTKLKEWFIDRKIPQAWRDTLPLVCADGEIAAIVLPQQIIVMQTSHSGEQHIWVRVNR